MQMQAILDRITRRREELGLSESAVAQMGGSRDLTLDQDGIKAWIAANVAPGDLSFANSLQVMTQGQEYQLKDITASAKIAHCAAVQQAAAASGLIR